MFNSPAFRKWLRKVSGSTRGGRTAKRGVVRLRVEGLEDRALPSAPVVVSVNPTGNAQTAPLATNVSVTFDQAIEGSTVSPQSFAVQSSMHGQLVGSLVSSLTTSGPTVTLAPAAPFFPGEVVEVTATAQITNGAAEGAVPFVSQFQTGVSGGTGVLVDSGQALSDGDSRRVRLGDVNGDGTLDAVVASTDGVRVWLNDGHGHFTDSGQILAAPGANDVSLGDLNGDGSLDLFVGTAGSGARVFLNDGHGHFTDSGQVLGSGDDLGVALGDLDGDGDLDAFVATGRYQPDQVWLNDGHGHFTQTAQALGNDYGNRVALGDLNGDGTLDAVVANSAGQQTRVWFNDGHGNFTAGPALTRNGLDVVLGDVDGDGDLDLLVDTVNQTQVWLNDGHGNFTNSGAIATGYRSQLALGDLNGDGALDLFVANASGQPNRLFLNDGHGHFTDSGQAFTADGFQTAALGDLDGDGDLDVFTTTQSHGDHVLLNTDFVAKAGGPYTVAEGSSLTLDASGSFGLDSLLSFRWDVNGDGNFDENVTGATPTLTWDQLVALGVNDGPAARTVTVEAFYGNTVRFDSATLAVVNTPPTAQVTGPSIGVRGQTLTFAFAASDPSPVDQAAGFTFTINWGDGTTQTVTAPSGTDVDHIFTQSGTYTITVTATDKDGGVSGVSTETVTVSAVAVEDGTLVVGGTTGSDIIAVTPGLTSGSYVVTILSPAASGTELTIAIVSPQPNGYAIDLTVGNVHIGVFTVPYTPSLTQLEIYAQAGNDAVTVSSAVTLPAVVFGGDGDDVLVAGGGPTALVGGDGDDVLVGGAGRDLLIGGSGSDILNGNAADDILIAGTTNYDTDKTALEQILGVWNGSGTYQDRISALQSPDFAYPLIADQTVHDDNAVDVLTGGPGSDWFFANIIGSGSRDRITDRRDNEVESETNS